MLPQKQQAFKFVIRSKITSDDSSAEPQHNLSEQTTSDNAKSKPVDMPPVLSEETERKRKRTDKDVIPIASKKVSYHITSFIQPILLNSNIMLWPINLRFTANYRNGIKKRKS
ncbi:uncharacterized protein BYT42DRAFT_309775 [Radiomyces spectabilis]|uniref:uncharacterized protein n=1 Tax=Radiomyces spectabilis TaxID=64574 RepID=UPI002220E081|nr:uncharacterized protein BYT42DRAFT_309775 [Radiomyces spectabilis]KAI8381567.1 hypothetical protein BYT42DRAFT_309775 [Radiomyces spectabilis]